MLFHHSKNKALPFIFLISCLQLLSPCMSWAGRPMIVDDATLVNPYSCQLETWFQHDPTAKEYWAMPACNIGGNFELSMGGGRIDTEQPSRHTNYLALQAKTIIKPLAVNNWGLGVAAGTQLDASSMSHQDWFLNIPFSMSLLNDQLLVHANVGLLHQYASQQYLTTWGLGLEKPVNNPLTLVAEIYDNNRSDPSYQAGFRYMINKDHLELDGSYGAQLATRGNTSFASIGLVLFTDPFLK